MLTTLIVANYDDNNAEEYVDNDDVVVDYRWLFLMIMFTIMMIGYDYANLTKN